MDDPTDDAANVDPRLAARVRPRCNPADPRPPANRPVMRKRLPDQAGGRGQVSLSARSRSISALLGCFGSSTFWATSAPAIGSVSTASRPSTIVLPPFFSRLVEARQKKRSHAMSGLQHLCRALADDNTWRHRVAGCDARHNGTVSDTKMIDPMDLERAVHH